MPRILVADDDLEQLTLRTTLLEDGGHQVFVAPTVSETLRQVERGRADLVIMDLRFPNADGEPDSSEGLALIRRIRELGCRIPVIVLSGWPEELYGRPEEKLVSRIIVKPVGMAVLLDIVRELVNSQAHRAPGAAS
jgi:two-component system response regulator GlrR